MKYLTWKTFGKAMGWAVLVSTLIFITCAVFFYLLNQCSTQKDDSVLFYTIAQAFAVVVFPFAVGINVNEQIRKKKRTILEEKITRNEMKSKDFWNKHTFYGKVIEDATGKVIEEWTKNSDNFYPKKIEDEE